MGHREQRARPTHSRARILATSRTAKSKAIISRDFDLDVYEPCPELARIRFRLHLPDAAVKCLLQCVEVAEDVGFGNDRWDHLQLLEKIEVGHGNAHHQHAHPGRISLVSASFSA